MKAEMVDVDPQHMLRLWTDLLHWTPTEAFSEISAPIHAINGELVSEAARERCRDHVTEHHLEGAGHFPHVEMPQRLPESLRGALSKKS
jgi:hypothetical protein